MPDITVTASITRGQLSLSPLTIENAADASCPYHLGREGMGPGQLTWRRNTVTSPFIHGRFPVNMVMDTPQMNMNFRVTGASVDWLDYNIGQLINAFTQFSYIVTLYIDGVYHQYICEAADYSVGNAGQFQDLNMRSHQQEVKFIVPRYPVPFGTSSRY